MQQLRAAITAKITSFFQTPTMLTHCFVCQCYTTVNVFHPLFSTFVPGLSLYFNCRVKTKKRCKARIFLWNSSRDRHWTSRYCDHIWNPIACRQTWQTNETVPCQTHHTVCTDCTQTQMNLAIAHYKPVYISNLPIITSFSLAALFTPQISSRV